MYLNYAKYKCSTKNGTDDRWKENEGKNEMGEKGRKGESCMADMVGRWQIWRGREFNCFAAQ